MTDHSLLMSGPMVRSLPERPGQRPKVQTRRLLTPDNTLFDGAHWRKIHRAQEWDWDNAWVDPGPSPAGNPGPYLHLPWKSGRDDDDALNFAGTTHRIYPEIQPSDRLWLQECYHAYWGRPFEGARKIVGASVRQSDGTFIVSTEEEPVYAHYRADDRVGANRAWRPSIHMPRWASRWTLFVGHVRIERLQAITAEDAKFEGLTCLSKDDGRTWKWGIPDRDGWPGNDDDGWHWQDWSVDPIDAYRRLWNQINEKRGHGWDRNPWVIVIEFTASPVNIGPAETKEPK